MTVVEANADMVPPTSTARALADASSPEQRVLVLIEWADAILASCKERNGQPQGAIRKRRDLRCGDISPTIG
ncbi:MAG: hypothetical protein WA962_14005 [Ornithinimicrobium sp.]